MADKEEGEETTSRGNEWEVVSLTASAYAAAPGPEQVEMNDVKEHTIEKDEAESSHALYMSGHFVFPPNQHENLPLEPEDIEVQNLQEIGENLSKLGPEEGGKSDAKDDESWDIKRLDESDEFPGIQIFDEKGNRKSIHGSELDETTTLQGVSFIENEQSMYSSSKFSSFHSETTMGGSITYDESTVLPGQVEPSEGGLDSEIPLSPELEKADYDSSKLPCEAWWKRGAASLYAHAKEANAFWSVFIAAAVMGLVILGQHWQQERWQVLQLKWQLSVNDEKMGRMLGPISRLKDVIVGGSRRGSSIRGGSSTEH